MAIYVAYDISDEHVAFKAALEAEGYSDWVQGTNGRVNLPNTTLIHSTKTTAEGREDMKAAARALQVTLERAIAINANGWAAINGTPHT